MKHYNYFTFGANDSYGQPQLSEEAQGTIKMAIYTYSQALTNNINYKDATYIGLTTDTEVKDTYVIDYEGARLKVLYIKPEGKLKQVFMGEL